MVSFIHVVVSLVSLSDDVVSKETVKDLQLLLRTGLSSLLTSTEGEQQLNIEDIVGQSEDNKWVVETKGSISEEEAENNSQKPDNIYQYEG